MNDHHDRLRPLDYLALAGLLLYALAVAVGVVWLIIQVVRLIIATGYAELCFGVASVGMAAILIVAIVRR